MSVVIFGKDTCSWCDRAVEVCNQYGLEYTYKSLDDRFTGEAFKGELRELALRESLTINTVPQIWWNGKYVGGYSQLISAIENTREYGQGGF